MRSTRWLLLLAVTVAWLQVAEPVAASQTPGLIYSGPNLPRIALTFDADMSTAMLKQVLAGTQRYYDPGSSPSYGPRTRRQPFF